MIRQGMTAKARHRRVPVSAAIISAALVNAAIYRTAISVAVAVAGTIVIDRTTAGIPV